MWVGVGGGVGIAICNEVMWAYIFLMETCQSSQNVICTLVIWASPPPPLSFLILSEINVLPLLYLSVLMNSAETLAERRPSCHVFFLVVLLHLIRLSVNCELWCPQNKFFVLKEKKCLILSSGGPIKVYTWCVVYIVLFFVLVIPSEYTFSVYFTLFYS